MDKLKKKLKKLTLFDRVLILLFIAIIAFFAYVFFRKSEFVTVTLKTDEENVRYEAWSVQTGTRTWFSQLFHEGMRETDGLGRVMAEVVSVRSYDMLPARKAVYLTTNLRAVYSRSSGNYTFKGKPLLIGSPIKLNLNGVFVEGLVTHVEGVPDPRQRVDLIVEARIVEENETYLETSGTSEHIAEALETGEIIKDDQGRIIMRILDKKVENAKRLVTTSDGRALTRNISLRKDVYLVLDVNAFKVHNRYYVFDDVPLLVGETFPLNTPEVSILPEVTKISTKD